MNFDLIALRAHGRYGFVAGLARRGQIAPSRDDLGSRIAQLCFIHHPPDVLNEARERRPARGERRQRRVELSQRGAMFVLPGCEQRLAGFFSPNGLPPSPETVRKPLAA